MRILLLALLISTIVPPGWMTSFENAKEIAERDNKMILLNFSGSDWCSPCVSLKKEVFENEKFGQIADQYLVLLNADFPRTKKNKLLPNQIAHNEALADQFNPNGRFPYTILLNKNGTVVKSWDGYHPGHAEEFLTELKQVLTNP